MCRPCCCEERRAPKKTTVSGGATVVLPKSLVEQYRLNDIDTVAGGAIVVVYNDKAGETAADAESTAARILKERRRY